MTDDKMFRIFTINVIQVRRGPRGSTIMELGAIDQSYVGTHYDDIFQEARRLIKLRLDQQGAILLKEEKG